MKLLDRQYLRPVNANCNRLSSPPNTRSCTDVRFRIGSVANPHSRYAKVYLCIGANQRDERCEGIVEVITDFKSGRICLYFKINAKRLVADLILA